MNIETTIVMAFSVMMSFLIEQWGYIYPVDFQVLTESTLSIELVLSTSSKQRFCTMLGVPLFSELLVATFNGSNR